jgi:hypothetical protein
VSPARHDLDASVPELLSEEPLRHVDEIFGAGALLLAHRHERVRADLGEGRQRTAEIEHVVRPLLGEPNGLR